jgi:hypothetical protein
MSRTRNAATAASAVVMTVIGVATPALATDFRDSHMTRWSDGDRSKDWKVTKKHQTSVTFNSCTHEFRATIRHNRTLRPDEKVATEWIDCQSGADAVRGTAKDTGDHHFDISGMGTAWCLGGQCTPHVTTVPSLRISW